MNNQLTTKIGNTPARTKVLIISADAFKEYRGQVGFLLKARDGSDILELPDGKWTNSAEPGKDYLDFSNRNEDL